MNNAGPASSFRLVASGLAFPEGPVALPDGSVLVVEIAGGTLTRVCPGGTVERVAELGGGPNGAAIGADGAVYVANNGGAIRFRERDGSSWPDYGADDPPAGGSLQRVDLETGSVETLYEACDGHRLNAPNDLVVAGDGSIWFTDLGLVRPRSIERGGVYWCRPDGSEIREVIFPLDQPNGIGLSPAGDRVYVAETNTGRLWGWDIAGPGDVVSRLRPATVAGAMLLADPGHLTGSTHWRSTAPAGSVSPAWGPAPSWPCRRPVRMTGWTWCRCLIPTRRTSASVPTVGRPT